MYFKLVFHLADKVGDAKQLRVVRSALNDLVSELGLEHLTPYDLGDECPGLAGVHRREPAGQVIDSVMAVLSSDRGGSLTTLDDGLFLDASRDRFDGDVRLQLEVRGHVVAVARFLRATGLRASRMYGQRALLSRLLRRVPLLRLIYFDVRLELLLTESSRGVPTRRATRTLRRTLMYEGVAYFIDDVSLFVNGSVEGASVLLEWAAGTTASVLRNPVWRFRHARHRGPAPRWEVQLATKRVVDDDGTERVVGAAPFIGNAAYLADNPPGADFAGDGVDVITRSVA